ncbi:MAG TPA: SufD family Fe-S cluster assembly protein, partial [Candidatus Bathyarchaeota archaeon]|nr:SufD family Fe-S cluster assembly protein [Candidatus Bathyarchaeota archaeon]
MSKEKKDKREYDLTGSSTYVRKAAKWSSCPISNLPEDIISRSSDVGVIPDEDTRAATYFQIDHSVVSKTINEKFRDQVEVMSTREAIKKYDWFKNYWWRLIRRNADKFTQMASSMWDHGYFIRILEDQKVTLPIQSCLFVSTDNLNQNVHNVVIAEAGSEAQVITGCASHTNVHRGLHVGVSEFYIKEDAKLTFTMIHGWSEGFDSRPRSAAIIGENGVFISNYLLFTPVRSLQMYPVAYCSGKNSKVRFNSILYGSKDSYIDVGSKIVLQNDEAGGEIITRAVATDNAQIYMRGFLEGRCEDCRAHLECRGLLLSDDALIHAVPELLAKAPGADLSHEAAVGKIAEEEIHYLMARGFSEREAVSLIVRGFMDVSIFNLPAEIEKRM